MPTTIRKDMTLREFNAACARRGYTASGVLGYYNVTKDTSVSVFNVGPAASWRQKLAYLIHQEKLALLKDRNHKKQVRLQGAAKEMFEFIKRWECDMTDGGVLDRLSGWKRKFVEEAREIIAKVETES